MKQKIKIEKTKNPSCGPIRSQICSDMAEGRSRQMWAGCCVSRVVLVARICSSVVWCIHSLRCQEINACWEWRTGGRWWWWWCVCFDGSYTRLNYQAGECHSAMAGSHTATSELESHPSHRLTEESHWV